MAIMILKQLKETIKETIKLVYIFPNYRRCISAMKNCDQIKIVLIGTPAHGNLGDQAIALSELKFIEDNKGNAAVFEIPMPLYKTHRSRLKKYIRKNDLIIISGGGWMGNLWIHNEITIREIVNDYHENKIIIFPQTLYYTEDAEGKKVASETKNIFKQHSNLYLIVRDHKSYKIASDLLEFDRNKYLLFCPDMVLYGNLAISPSQEPLNRTALICLRNDIEKSSDSNQIKSTLITCGYSIQETTSVLKQLVKMSRRKNVVMNTIKIYSSASLMVTDRLHAMIFSLLAGIPCYVFDNSTGKVFGTASYLQETGMPVKMFRNIKTVQCNDFNLKGKPYELPPSLKDYFRQLAELLKTAE